MMTEFMPSALSPGQVSSTIWLSSLTILVAGTALFWTWGVLKSRKKPSGGSEEFPEVSIVIAGRNEELLIGRVLMSVLQSDYPIDKFLVYFVDDHSADQTLRIASQLAVKFPGNLRVLSAPPVPAGHSPKKNALAFGIRQAGGNILLFTDADARVNPGWIEAMVNAYSPDTGAVAGATMPGYGKGLHQRFYRLERLMVAYTSASAIGHGAPASVTGQNFSFRREAFEDVGGYAHLDAASGDDDLMVQAIAQRGWEVNFCLDPNSVVCDLRPPTAQAHLAAATRHQSTIRFYPWRWRFTYLATIVGGFGLLAGFIFLLFRGEYLGVMVLVMCLKMVIDALGIRKFVRRLHIPLSLTEFLAAEVLLPFYLIARPLMAMRKSFHWRGRLHKATPQPASEFVL